jgi:hypothetical protein
VKEISVEELAAQERKEYFKAWRAANKEKTAQHRRNYWEKRALAKMNAEQGEGNNDTDTNADKQ